MVAEIFGIAVVENFKGFVWWNLRENGVKAAKEENRELGLLCGERRERGCLILGEERSFVRVNEALVPAAAIAAISSVFVKSRRDRCLCWLSKICVDFGDEFWISGWCWIAGDMGG
ncbi:unnamed protein product [Fraxinus pennsylvanica]|uniref:Uncharacterized protein n=1 Tax=Fraxinus pennsylvanica TaxID=56036 RepID=A0AAD2AFJ9_9LAMI|nr:unnamed protein product [Fraxinus pennsylvanica]